MAAMVAWVEPVSAPNRAQANTATVPVLARTRPTKASMKLKMLFDIPEYSMIAPANRKNGIASREKLSNP